jgi:hypothetical protein
MRHPKWPWLGPLILLLAPASSYAQAHPNSIAISAKPSAHVPTCAKFATACALGGICPEAVFAGKISGSYVGKGKVEVDVANGVPGLTDATLDENGCTPMYLDICYSTGKAPAQEMVAQLSQCPAENGDEGSESVVGGYQLIRSRNKLNGWGQVTGTMQLTGSSATVNLTLSGILEH